ncbi:MAG: tetratricopeptide repeat protein [Bryobacterales bacterium]|nr:tetratricopeptide repeat protein [Bryobacterales bacterium]
MGRFLQAHAGHFAFAFVRVNDSTMRDGAISRLRGDVPSIQVIDYSEGPERWLLSDLRRRDLSQTEALFLVGLETTILTRTDFVRSLNHDREGFPEVVRCPMLMWLSDAAVDRMMREAPDFVDWHAAAFRLDEESVAPVGDWLLRENAMGLSPEFLRDRARLLEESLHSDERRTGRRHPLVAARLEELARLHLDLKDLDLALDCANQAIESRELGGDEEREALAEAYLLRAEISRRMNRYAAALGDYDESVRAAAKDTTGQVRKVRSLMGRATVLAQMKRYREALEGFDQAASALDQLPPDVRAGMAEDRAAALVNASNAMHMVKQYDEAISGYDAALRIREDLVRRGRTDLRESVATTYINKGIALTRLKRYDEALKCYESAEAILEQLSRDGAAVSDLQAAATLNMANALLMQQRIDEALAAYGRVLEIREGMWDAGRLDVDAEISNVLMNRAVALMSQGRAAEALPDFERAQSIRERLVQARRSDLREELAHVLVNHAIAIGTLGDPDRALALIERAVDIRRQLHREGFHHQTPELQSALEQLAGALETAGRNDEAARARAEAASLSLSAATGPV